MKVFFHEDFYQVYTTDPAAAAGRMEAIVEVIRSEVELVTAEPVVESVIAAVHTKSHISDVIRSGLYEISALAAGGAVQTAQSALEEPCFGLIRPPGHHASAGSAWGFCYFNNMAIALEQLKKRQEIETAYVLDIDLHFGDGTVNIFKDKEYVTVHNVKASQRLEYLEEVKEEMANCSADIIGISAGFDNHEKDWGGTLKTHDYRIIGEAVRTAADRLGGGCFGLLEGGYNHGVLGRNVLALIQGLKGEGY